MTFTKTGDRAHDHWLAYGQREFSIFPPGITVDINAPIPIILPVGNRQYGAIHIHDRHGQWVNRHAQSVPELVYTKLGQGGSIHVCEEQNKLKVSLTLAPQALMILTLIERTEARFFSVTTLYTHNKTIIEKRLGRYPGRAKAYELCHKHGFPLQRPGEP